MQKLINFNYIYLIPLLLSVVFSLKSFRLNWPRPYKLFSNFLIATLLVEIFAISWKWYLYHTSLWSYSKSNLWVYDSFILIRTALILGFYFLLLDSYILKKTITFLIIGISVFGLINYFFIQTPHQVNTYTIVAGNCLVVFFSLIYFRQLLRNKEIVKLSSIPAVWITLGNFIYYSGTLPLFILFNYLVRYKPNVASSYFHINDILNILLYFFYLIAYLCRTPKYQR